MARNIQWPNDEIFLSLDGREAIADLMDQIEDYVDMRLVVDKAAQI